MANYTELKAAVSAVIKQNGNNEITGALLQNTLLSIINNVGANATYIGTATPTTNPGSPDGNVFYISAIPGQYVNFGGLVLERGKAYTIVNGANNAWSAIAINIPSIDAIVDLNNVKVDSDAIIERINYFNNALFQNGYYLNDTGGTIHSTNSAWNGSAIAMNVKVDPNTEYQVYTPGATARLYSIWQYDKNGVAIGKVSSLSKFTTNENTYTLGICWIATTTTWNPDTSKLTAIYKTPVTVSGYIEYNHVQLKSYLLAESPIIDNLLRKYDGLIVRNEAQLFNFPGMVKYGKYVSFLSGNVNGIRNDANYFCGCIPATSGETYTFSNMGYVSSNSAVAFAKDGLYISGIVETTLSQFTVTVPEGANEIWFNIHIKSTAPTATDLQNYSQTMVNIGNTAQSFVTYWDIPSYVKKANLFITYVGKNLFNKDTIIDGYYIGSTPGTLNVSSQSSISALIPIEAGETYALYRAKDPNNTANIQTRCARFVAADRTTPIKPINPATGLPYPSNYEVGTSMYGTVLLQAPDDAVYLQFTVRFNSVQYNYETIQAEKGNTTTQYEPYKEKQSINPDLMPYSYEAIPGEIEDLNNRVAALENNSIVEKINISNAGKIGFFSNSFLNGYCMKGKHALDNLSMFSDYLFYNFGHSGDDALECLARINRNETWLGVVPVQNWGLTFGVIAMQDNDGALFAASTDTYFENFKKLAEAIEAMGATPILGTEHDYNNFYYGLSRLANERGYMFMKWGRIATALFRSVFPPFWYNSHPATRTHWMWTYGMKQYLDTLPRPDRGIKLFRVRPAVDTSDKQNMVFTDNISRAERYVEIENGAAVLTTATEQYFDRLNQGGTYTSAYNEYQYLQNKSQSVAFGNYALIECIVPFDRNSINTLKMLLTATGVTKAYVKRNLSLANPLPDKRYIAFGVTAGANLLTPGSTFTVTGGVFSDTLLGTYTVEDVVNGIVVTTTLSTGKTTSGTDNPTTNVSGVTLQGSYDYPTADYMQRFRQPLGEWDEIQLNGDGETDLSAYLSYAMDFDKMAILLEGSNITISDISFETTGSRKKNTHGMPFIARKYGASLLTDTLLDDGTAWDNIASVPKYTPVLNPVNSSPEALPNGITTVREISEGDQLTQTIKSNLLNTSPYRYSKMQIRVVARYFPLYVDTDAKFAQSAIKQGTYDCAKMAVSIGGTVVCATAEVGTYWNEFVFDTDYFNGTNIAVKCLSKTLQIAKVEVDLID